MLKRRGGNRGPLSGESSSREADKKIWNKVWSLPIPNKGKHFVGNVFMEFFQFGRISLGEKSSMRC